MTINMPKPLKKIFMPLVIAGSVMAVSSCSNQVIKNDNALAIIKQKSTHDRLIMTDQNGDRIMDVSANLSKKAVKRAINDHTKALKDTNNLYGETPSSAFKLLNTDGSENIAIFEKNGNSTSFYADTYIDNEQVNDNDTVPTVYNTRDEKGDLYFHNMVLTNVDGDTSFSADKIEMRSDNVQWTENDLKHGPDHDGIPSVQTLLPQEHTGPFKFTIYNRNTGYKLYCDNLGLSLTDEKGDVVYEQAFKYDAKAKYNLSVIGFYSWSMTEKKRAMPIKENAAPTGDHSLTPHHDMH